MNKTNWDAYYAHPFVTATFTRRITTARLIDHMRRFLAAVNPKMVELGGANSCFVDALHDAFCPSEYAVVDNNKFGLSLLAQRCPNRPWLKIVEDDVLNSQKQAEADLVFSVGLVEHFDAVGTARAIAAHYRFARSGGVVIISFPTPTWLYRLTRTLAEILGLWKFPDERPLEIAEVRAAMCQHGEVLAQDIIWPIVLTQGLLIGRKS
jgi:SAM-dependent methyltransferase